MISMISPSSKEMRICLFLIGILFLLLFAAKPIYCHESFFDSDEGKLKNTCQGYYSLTLIKKTPSGEQWILKDNDKSRIVIDLLLRSIFIIVWILITMVRKRQLWNISLSLRYSLNLVL